MRALVAGGHTGERTEPLPERLKIIEYEGVEILGAYIGSDTFVAASLNEHLDKVARSMQLLSEMNDAHVAFTLLRCCLSAAKINFHLRTIPVSQTGAAAPRYDDMLSKTLRTIIGSCAPQQQLLDKMSLPLNISNSQRPRIGAGFTKATDVAAPAYLASIAQSRPLVNALLRKCRMNLDLSAHGHSMRVHAAVAACPHEPNLADLDAMHNSPPKQRELLAAAHAYRIQQLPELTPRGKRLRNALTLPRAKYWLRNVPCPARYSHIQPHAFRTSLQHYFEVPLFNDTSNDTARVCPRPNCCKPCDKFGDHFFARPAAASQVAYHELCATMESFDG